jgi:rod shape-determining protein MreD
MMVGLRPRNAWIIWCSFAIALLLSVAPMPSFMGTARPLWLALFVTYWALALPHRVGMTSAWLLGLAGDVLAGSLLGLHALTLTVITFLVLSLHQRLRMFPLWQQSLVLLVIFGLAQLIDLWLNALSGIRPPASMSIISFILPALISALLWPWVFGILRATRLRFGVN